MAAEHYEQQYLRLLAHVWEKGDRRMDRTGVGTRSVFGATLRFDLLDDAVPLLTTKRVAWKVAIRELLWFLSGSTNIRPLVAEGVHIWTDWPLDRYRRATGDGVDRAAFEARILADDAFAREWGELGPVYGKQWVDWPTYQAAEAPGLYTQGPGINQVADLVARLRADPASRRHLFTGWNVAEIGRMALPPCHMTYQYHVAGGRLSGLVQQRSCDLGLGLAFNLFSAAALLRMLAQQCDLAPGELIWNGGDVHVYENHGHLVDEQLSREPRGHPKLRLTRHASSIFDYSITDFEVLDYEPHPHIAAPVAV